MDSENRFDFYVERLKKIRTLSSPSLDGIEDGMTYSQRLRDSFVQIGHLAAENRPLLEDQLFPLIKQEKKLIGDEIREISVLEEKLLDAGSAENLDLSIAFLLSDRLYKDAMSKEDLFPKIRRMDMQISVCYTMMNMTNRLYEYPEISWHYRNQGLEIVRYFLKLREKERFREIKTQQEREMVLTNARFAVAFYENMPKDRDDKKDLEMIRESIKIEKDPFYIDLMPDFDWRYYHYRLLTYYSQLTFYNNQRGFNESELQEVWERSEELWDLWHSDPDYFSELETESYIKLQLLRNRYLAGKITRQAYRDSLLELYHGRDKSLYDLCGITENIQIPIELLGLFWKERLSEADKVLNTILYNNVMAYVFHMPNSGVLSFMLELTLRILKYFVEIPGSNDFETVMLNMMAAMHPPTYVHSRMVAQFATCLCGHLIDTKPELLIGVEGCKTVDEVTRKRYAILNFTWHAALCHDTGKICIIDTIFIYGRKLLDMEFDLVMTHPKMGAAILKRFTSTEKYADVALGHHKWYDNSRGYPTEFDTRTSPVKTIIDIVECADCLDAATDTVGRSYSRGKSFDGVLEEIREGSGTRYAPWLPELLTRDEVREDIEYLLAEGREKNYYDTYKLLKSLHEKESQ